MPPPLLSHHVAMTYPAAVQAIAALEDRILHLRALRAEAWAIADCHAAVMALRETFNLYDTEAAMDAAHEAAHAALDDLAAVDVPAALDSYWNRGA